MSDIPMNSTRQRMIGRAIAIFFAVMLLLTFLSNTINNFSLPVVEYESPGGGMLIEQISSSGVVTAKRTQSIAPDISRLVDEVRVKVGDRVSKGQILVILNRIDLEAQLAQDRIRYEQLKLSLTKIENQLKNEEKDLDTMRAVYAVGGETRVNLEQAEAELANLQSDLGKAEDDIRLQELNIAELRNDLGVGSTLIAPFDGIVTELNYDPGARTSPSLAVVTIAAFDGGFVFTAAIDVESAGYLVAGDPATVNLGGLDGQKLQGRITEIRDTQGQVGVKKDILIDLPGEGLRGGESGDLTIEKNIGNYEMLVSNSAIGDGDDGKFVYVLNEKRGPLGNEYYVWQVTLAIGESDNLKTAGLSGLQTGDKVIIGSDKQISDGSRVMVNQ